MDPVWCAPLFHNANSLQYCLVNGSTIYIQENGTKEIMDYVHNDGRAHMPGWGPIIPLLNQGSPRIFRQQACHKLGARAGVIPSQPNLRQFLHYPFILIASISGIKPDGMMDSVSSCFITVWRVGPKLRRSRSNPRARTFAKKSAWSVRSQCP